MLGPQRAQRKSQSGEFRGQPGPVAMLPRPARSPPAAEFFQEKSKFTVRFFGQKAIYRENLPSLLRRLPMPLLPPELPASCLDYATASIRQMLQALLRARTYARRVGGDMWDFAEELATLRNTGIANADLRWLLHHGVISHAEEISRARASRRRFRELGKLMLPEKSSFVLTDLGESLMRRLPTNGRESNGQHRSAPSRPLWHKDIRELYL